MESEMPKIEPFEKYYEEYDKWFDENKYIYLSELKAIKILLPKGKGLEIGIGTGRFAIPLVIKIGIDPSPKMREIAEKRGIKVIDGIAEKIPFADNEFNFVLLVTTICFLDDIDMSLKEIYRILKPDGSIIIGLIDKNSAVGMLYLKNKVNDPFYKEANFYSTEEVINKLIENNFCCFEFKQTIFGELKKNNKIQKIKDGYGHGSFVVIKAKKNLIIL
jgi:ubiquinone/menaquinone biosynthesis C-methylase UbiE